MSGCNRWAHVWIHVWSRSRPASQGGRQSWAGRGGRWLWQDLEGNFPESQGQEHLGLRCSDWPANRPWGPRSARCCCWRSLLEHRRYIAYCPRTETADWPSASPRCHCAKSVRGVGTIKVWRQKCRFVHARESIAKVLHAKEHNATAKHTSQEICKSLGRALGRERKNIRRKKKKKEVSAIICLTNFTKPVLSKSLIIHWPSFRIYLALFFLFNCKENKIQGYFQIF